MRIMRGNPTNEEKAKIYNYLLSKYQMLQEQVRLIRAENLNLGPNEEMKIKKLEDEMKKIYNQTQKLY